MTPLELLIVADIDLVWDFASCKQVRVGERLDVLVRKQRVDDQQDRG